MQILSGSNDQIPSLKQSDLKVGDKVRYQPVHYDEKFENGLIKNIPGYAIDSVYVVYDCNEDWKNYTDYTSALTYLKDIKLGWK